MITTPRRRSSPAQRAAAGAGAGAGAGFVGQGGNILGQVPGENCLGEAREEGGRGEAGAGGVRDAGETGVEEELMCGAGDEGGDMEEGEEGGEGEEGEAGGEGGAEEEWRAAPGLYPQISGREACHMRRRIHVSYEEEDTCQISGREASFQRIPEFNAPPTASVALEIDHAPQTYAHKVLRVELGFSLGLVWV